MDTIGSFIAVALCWGFTNPFIKRGAMGLEEISQQHKTSSATARLIAEYRYLFTTWTYLLPLVINLSGSLVYYYTLGSADLSLAVPIANSLTFAFTALAGIWLGEDFGSRNAILGIMLVMIGVLLCIYSKL